MSYESASRPIHEATAKCENVGISLTPHHVAFLEACVESGKYQSTSEVVRDALRFLEDALATQTAERQRARALMLGVEQHAKGQGMDSDRFFGEWEAEFGTFGRGVRP